jgi:hypothetical protein
MDDIDRKAIQLCRQLPEALEKMFDLFDNRAKEIARLFPPNRKIVANNHNLFGPEWLDE